MTREEAIGNIRHAIRWNDMSEKEALDMAIKALEHPEQNVIVVVPCGDAISRKSIKQKLQEHHDFFVNAYGGFSNLPPNDKSRVDEITNCIAMVVNEPSVNPKPKTGRWMQTNEFFINQDGQFIYKFICSECKSLSYFRKSNKKAIGANVCPNCGAKMVEPQGSEG